MVALSSTEAEYIGCSDAVKDGLYFQRLLEEVITHSRATHISPQSPHTSSSPQSLLPSDTTQATRIPLTSTCPLVIHMDNQSAMHIASNGRPNERTKHIDIRHHHIKDMIAGGHFFLFKSCIRLFKGTKNSHAAVSYGINKTRKTNN